MTKLSAGILLVRPPADDVGAPEFLLVHPGGPFWRSKDRGSWSIPKGEHLPGEDPLDRALKEFEEELGVPCPATQLISIGSVTQNGGKRVTAWCGLGSIDTTSIVSNSFEMIWPPRSGTVAQFPEVDRAEFFTLGEASVRILHGQLPLLDAAIRALQEAGLLSPGDTG